MSDIDFQVAIFDFSARLEFNFFSKSGKYLLRACTIRTSPCIEEAAASRALSWLAVSVTAVLAASLRDPATLPKPPLSDC